MATRPPRRPAARRPAGPAPGGIRLRLRMQPVWVRRALIGAAAAAGLMVVFLLVLWISYGRMIDARLAGEQRQAPRVFGRAFTLHVGRGLTPRAARATAERCRLRRARDDRLTRRVLRHCRVDDAANDTDCDGPDDRPRRFLEGQHAHDHAAAHLQTKKPIERLALERPVIASMDPGEKRMHVPLASIRSA